MRKVLIMMAIILVGIGTVNTVSYAGEVVSSNTSTVDALLNESNKEAQSDNKTQNVTNQENTSINSTESSVTVADTTSYNTVKPVSMKQVEQKIAQKGGEVLSMTQMVGYVVITIFFVISLILLAVTRSTGSNDQNLRGVGFGGVIICCVCYVLVYAGPFMLEFFRNWSMS